MSKIRMNTELRSKILNRYRDSAEKEITQESDDFNDAREKVDLIYPSTFELARQVVARSYPPEDVLTCRTLKQKYGEPLDVVAKDKCFYFSYANENYREDDESKKEVSEHFDFGLYGDTDNGNSYNNETGKQFAYAYYRDELKAKDECNPDINIEMENKDRNPYQTKYNDANEKALGFSSGNDNLISHARDWDNNYELDLIGREYCRDRQIPVSKAEYQTFVIWQQAKGQMIMAHYKWIKSVLTQCSKIKTWLKSWKYLDEALDFCAKAKCPIDEAEIIRCNSTGLAIFNPQNCADYLESMKNKNVSREQKILARKLYDKQQIRQ